MVRAVLGQVAEAVLSWDPGPREPEASLRVAPPQVLWAARSPALQAAPCLVPQAAPCLVLQAARRQARQARQVLRREAWLLQPAVARSGPFHRDGPWRGQERRPLPAVRLVE